MESADNSAAAEDMSSETAEKRPNKPSAKKPSTNNSCKLLKMVLNDKLMCFIGGTSNLMIFDPRVSWVIILTKIRKRLMYC